MKNVFTESFIKNMTIQELIRYEIPVVLSDKMLNELVEYFTDKNEFENRDYKEKIENLESEKSSLEDEVENLEWDVDSLKEELAAAERKIRYYEERI